MDGKNGFTFDSSNCGLCGVIMTLLNHLIAHKMLLVTFSFSLDNSSMHEEDNLVSDAKIQAGTESMRESWFSEHSRISPTGRF